MFSDGILKLQIQVGGKTLSVIFLAKFNTISDIGELVIHLNLINGVVENNCLITQYHCLCMCLRETKEAEGRRDGRQDRRAEGETTADGNKATGRERNRKFEASAGEFV